MAEAEQDAARASGVTAPVRWTRHRRAAKTKTSSMYAFEANSERSCHEGFINPITAIMVVCGLGRTRFTLVNDLGIIIIIYNIIITII